MSIYVRIISLFFIVASMIGCFGESPKKKNLPEQKINTIEKDLTPKVIPTPPLAFYSTQRIYEKSYAIDDARFLDGTVHTLITSQEYGIARYSLKEGVFHSDIVLPSGQYIISIPQKNAVKSSSVMDFQSVDISNPDTIQNTYHNGAAKRATARGTAFYDMERFFVYGWWSLYPNHQRYHGCA